MHERELEYDEVVLDVLDVVVLVSVHGQGLAVNDHLVAAGQVDDEVVLHALDQLAQLVVRVVDAQVELAALDPLVHLVVHQVVKVMDVQVALAVAVQVALYVALAHLVDHHSVDQVK